MSAIERLIELFSSKGLKFKTVEEACGLSKGYISTTRKRNSDVGLSVLNKIIDNYPDINLVWVVTGVGEMTLSKKYLDVTPALQSVEDPKELYLMLKKKDKEIELQYELLDIREQRIKKLERKLKEVENSQSK
ncbi:MAG: hypothetical protein JXR07_04975 [Reichenbachiella sp.]